MRILSWGLSSLFFVTTAACGGSVVLFASDGGVDNGEDASSGSSSGSSSGGVKGTSSNQGGSTGTSSPGEPAGDDAGCSTTALTFAPPASTAACWSCVQTGCATQLAACAADCSCDATVAGDVSCVNSGTNPSACIGPNIVPDNDDALTAVATCVLEASAECNCNNPPPDASAGCVQTGGGGGGGNGNCTSNFSEMCENTNYQVVCACPESECFCFNDATPDAGTTVVKFDGCPYCPGGPGPNSTTDLLSLCGFPH
jgi:hypothetical protein